MTYLLATTESKPRWYRVKTNRNGEIIGFDLPTRLDLKKVPRWGDKTTAKYVAKKLGLKTWRYVKI
jgi:hypothetical protein